MFLILSFFVFQISVPKSGGLHLAVLTQHGNERRGLPTTVIHILPVEVMLFVDMLPYYLLNRQDTSHTFWTSLGAILNLKHWAEDALDSGNLEFLSFALTCLQEDRVKDLLADAATFPDKNFFNTDVTSLRQKKFAVWSENVCSSDFAKVLCNQIFLLRYKLVDWEGRDDYSSHAKVVPREPPKMVYNLVSSSWKALYDVDDFNCSEEEEDDDNTKEPSATSSTPSPVIEEEPQLQPPHSADTEELAQDVEVFEKSQETGRIEKRKKKSKDRKVKKSRLTEEEWREVYAAVNVLHNDPDDMMIPTSQNCVTSRSKSPKLLNAATSTTEPPVRTRVESVHLHLHFNEFTSSKIRYESLENGDFRWHLEKE